MNLESLLSYLSILPKKIFRSSKDLPIVIVMIIPPFNFANTFWIPLWNLVRLLLRFPKPSKGNVNISKITNHQGFASSNFSKSALRAVLIFRDKAGFDISKNH